MLSLEERNQKRLNSIVRTEVLTKNFHDLSGQVIGMLHIDKHLGFDSHRDAIYECTCICGNKYIAKANDITRRKHSENVSCGCIREKYLSELIKEYHPTKHGDRSNSKYKKLYKIWIELRERCNNPNNKSYFHYGSRGIKVCPEWNNPDDGYINFKKWSLENGLKPGLTIDRINNDLGYYPENCQWTNNKVQCNNRRTTHYLQIGKYVFSVTIWAEIIGVPFKTLFSRINYGWPIKDVVLTIPGKPKGTYYATIEIPDKYRIYNKYDEFVKNGKAEEFTEDTAFGVKFIEIKEESID